MRAPTPAPVFRPQDHCEPHRAAPRKFRKHGSRTCRTPYQHSWDIPKNAVPAPDRGSGAPAAHRVQGLPAPLRQGAWPPPETPGILAVFSFLRISVTCTALPLSGFQGVHPGRHYMGLVRAHAHPGPGFQAPGPSLRTCWCAEVFTGIDASRRTEQLQT